MENIETPINPSDDRATRKAEQSARDRKTANKAKMMSLLRLLGISALLIAVIGGLIWIGETQDGSESQPSPTSNQVTAIDHVKGPETAAVTIIEYADFQCPTCAVFAPVMEQLSDIYANDLRIVYRYFPLPAIHANAYLAAQAAEAAGKQGKFWEMHDLLFARQKDWSSVKNAHDLFTTYATELELNVEQFKTDLDSKEVKNRVSADARSGSVAGIGGTPTFYLNGEVIENPRGIDAFKAVIDAKLPPKTAE